MAFYSILVPAQPCQRTNSLGLETPQGWTSRDVNHTMLKDLWNRAKLKCQHALGRRASLFHLKVQAGTVSASCLLASSMASHARFTWSVLLLQFLLVKAWSVICMIKSDISLEVRGDTRMAFSASVPPQQSQARG